MTKHLFYAVLMSLALAEAASAQPTNLYENDGNVIVPPQIAPQVDATNFVNKGLFDINLPINITQSGEQITYYETWDTLNFTNRNIITGATGFRFDNFAGGPGGNGLRGAAATFVNQGSITAGMATNTNIISDITGYLDTAQIIVTATNITNANLLEVGVGGLLSLAGNNINLTRGTLQVEDVAASNLLEVATPVAGIFNQFWGTGPGFGAFFFDGTNIVTPPSQVATPFTLFTNVQVSASNFVAYANDLFIVGDGEYNRTIQIIFIANTNPAISVDVRMDPIHVFVTNNGLPINIHWQSISTNRTGVVTTNNLYLTDSFAQDRFGRNLGTNYLSESGFLGSPPGLYDPTFSPNNFIFTTNFSNFNSFPHPNSTFNPAVIGNITNVGFYSAYGVTDSALTAGTIPNLPGSTISNLPGRIQINASNVLDLTHTIITGQNYLTLSATNHYVGSTNAQIASPYYDINLASTNGMLYVSNLVAPAMTHITGPIEMWSGGAIFQVSSNETDSVNVLIVNSDGLQTTGPVNVQNLQLSSTNVSISDIINVTNSPVIKAVSLTTTTNDAFSQSGDGEINLISSTIIWSGLTPILEFVTNYGGITTMNSVYFAGSRTPPYYSTTFTEPYQTFINHGFISVAGALVWANYFENSFYTNNFVLATNGNGIITNQGSITCLTGPFTLQASNALFSNAIIQASSDISLGSGNLIITNHLLQTGGALNLTVTNLLTDDVTNLATDHGNFWQTTFGMSLNIKPAMGDLLGTTITNTSPPNLEQNILWAGEDRGASAAGFLNNAAVGHLVLNGGDNNSAFLFSGPSPQNAMYVDLIELVNGATNRASTVVDTTNGQQIVQTYTAVDVTAGMTLYFADAMASGEDISEKLNGNVTVSGGHVVWVPSYAGLFSSTNVTYPSGITYRLNRALVESTDIDSNGNGTNNAFDPAPVFVSEDVKLNLSFTNTPALAAVVSWQTLAGATNSLYTSAACESGAWTLVTNFVANANGTVAVTNHTPGTGPLYYKVRVDPPQP